jgi:catalase (peroxidase I)
MGLNWDQTAALMGVHSLGRAHLDFSGYVGFWSDAESARRFDNDFYLSILAKGWQPETTSAGKHQWGRSDAGNITSSPRGKEMMLNTDLCLAYTSGFSDFAKDSSEREDLKAAEHNCCAWTRLADIRQAVDKYHDGKYCGKRQFCTFDTNDISIPTCREICCGKGVRDCNSFFMGGQGPAHSAVMSFASDELQWLRTFFEAWTKATENGFSNLQALQ